MQIRPFEPEDTEAVVALWQACGLVVAHNDPRKDIERKLDVDPDLFLVGEIDGTIIASVMGGYEGHRGWLNYLAVHPDHQGSGLAREIVSRVEDKIRAMGAPKINLQVRSTNSKVIAFYKALGYTVDEVVSMGKRLVRD